MKSQLIWSDATGAGRNRYVAFRKTFQLETAPASTIFELFADTRYRLMVNGQTVCHGPARFVLSHPEYDRVEIGAYLESGRNTVVVLVNSYNCNSFHSDISVGGFAADGEIRDGDKAVSLSSDSPWKCMVLDAFRGDTHALSFALNPAEHQDARRLPAGWDGADCDDGDWSAAVAVANRGNWGELAPRSIPMLDERYVLPRRRLATFVARAESGEEWASLAMEIPNANEQHSRSAFMVTTWIHSPRGQDVVLGAWWGEYYLSGQKLSPTKRQDVAFRQDFPVSLKEGWNLLAMRESWGQEAWCFYLGYPKSAGLTLSAEKKLDGADRFLVAGPWCGEQLEVGMKVALTDNLDLSLPKELGAWRAVSRTHEASNPVRERAWKHFEKLDAEAHLTCDGAAYAERVGQDTLVLLYDMDTEILGRLKLDFEAQAGMRVDVTFTERLKDDGVSDVHQRFFQDLGERYVAKEGRQTWHLMHPRGGRYVEVLVTGEIAKFKLHAIGFTRANYPVQDVGRLSCSDPVLNQIWDLGKRTQFACMEDAYLDCPMRERGLYAGDMLVQYLTNLASFGDHQLVRRCIEIFLYRQGENGLVSGGAQGLPAGRHPDYSAILAQACLAYYQYTGDAAWLGKIKPNLLKMLRGIEGLTVKGSDLLDGSDLHPYIDLQKMDRGGINCALNCFYQKAFVDGAAIFDILGDRVLGAHYREAAGKLAAAIRGGFWDSAIGAFTDRRAGDVERATPSVAANCLPILYDIAGPEQALRATAWLVDAMADNFQAGFPKRNDECRVTSYFSFYALGAMIKRGKVEESIAFMRRNWSHMLWHGAWTCWEYFADSQDSLCHAWSSCPTHYLSTLLLGVEFPEAGNMDKVRIRPRPGSIQWASGVYPHPRGEIRVSWRYVAGTMQLETSVPAGVEVVD